MVRDDGRPVNVTDGNKVEVKLSITDTTADKLVMDEKIPDLEKLGSGVIVFMSMMGLRSGPSLTARLANLTTVLVPLRREPESGSPKPCVSVHKPSA
jgi:hypothetical protein